MRPFTGNSTGNSKVYRELKYPRLSIHSLSVTSAVPVQRLSGHVMAFTDPAVSILKCTRTHLGHLGDVERNLPKNV